MKEMNESKMVTTDVDKDYSENFTPSVHKIGRSTMAISFILVFLPVIYLFAVKGYTMPLALYTSAGLAIFTTGIGMWLSEPEAVWPVLGSAGTYIAYLAGDVSSTRVTVAVACQKTADADISTPRGQVITIIGVVASVFMKLALLVVQVAVGTWLISILPDAVIASFSFVIPGGLAAMLIMNADSKDGMVRGATTILPYIVLAAIMWYVFNVLTSWWAFSMIACVGGSVLLGYIFYRIDLKKAEAADK